MKQVKCPNCDYVADSREQLERIAIKQKDYTLTICENCRITSRIPQWIEVDPKPVPACEAMIDIETFDTTRTAVVFQVAVVLFCPKTHDIQYQEIWNVDIDGQLEAGRTVSASTIAFHLGIPENAKKSLESENKWDGMTMLDGLTTVIERAKPNAIWQKGNFDIGILESMYTEHLLTPPWKFYQIRELRTMMKECGVGKGDPSHNALEDCLAQIKQLAECRGVIAYGTDTIEVTFDITSPIHATTQDEDNES